MTALEAINRVSAFGGAVFFIGMFVSVSTGIFARLFLGRPLGWTFEMSVYCFIYVTYLGAAIASKRGSHVAFDLIRSRFSRRIQAVFSVLCDLAIVVTLIALFPFVFSYIKFAGPLRSAAMGIPLSLVLLSFPIGMGIVVLYTLRHIASDARDLFTGGSGGSPER